MDLQALITGFEETKEQQPYAIIIMIMRINISLNLITIIYFLGMPNSFVLHVQVIFQIILIKYIT